MKSFWSDTAVKKNSDKPLHLRVYSSRLLGQQPDLVLHGGGNTSVKITENNLFGESEDILYVKGSGWDLGTIEPQGFPALDLHYLQRLRSLEQLTDEEMVNQFRTHMLDSSAPGPSIETLVHAFLPHKFIDHTHADSIVTLCDTLPVTTDAEHIAAQLLRSGITPALNLIEARLAETANAFDPAENPLNPFSHSQTDRTS